MNPLTNIKNLNAMNDRELEMGVAGTSRSWHGEYADSAWIFMGGLPYELTEGDVIAVFSQYGEVVHINLIRDHSTGKSKGFGFLCYEDQRSTVLAVDNLNGIRLVKRTIRVDHVHTYKLPKDLEKLDADRKKLFLEGVAPKPIQYDDESESEESEVEVKKEKKRKKPKKEDKTIEKKKKKKKRKRSSSSSDSSSESEEEIKREKMRKNRDRSRDDDHDRHSCSDRRRHRSRSRSRERRRSRSRSRSRERRRRR